MNVETLFNAIRNRAAIRIDDRNGWGRGLTGIALGHNTLYDTVKVGFVNEQGSYTGECTRVSRKHVELI